MQTLPWSLLVPCLGFLLLSGAPLRAAPTPAHPVVPGFERLAAGGKADASAGQLLLGELNCVSCHTTADPSILRKQAPLLDHVGQRVRIGYLKKFLADPHGSRPGTTMPDLLAGDPDRNRKVEALVH